MATTLRRAKWQSSMCATSPPDGDRKRALVACRPFVFDASGQWDALRNARAGGARARAGCSASRGGSRLSSVQT